ncbi:hypothetical protein HDV02_003072 [Globomyces sp. JEL0801]|nr:hypothetical protein HDV02_003072 [Globomyces sp. JEL0801]
MAGSGGSAKVYEAVYCEKEAVAKIPVDEESETLLHKESRLMSILNHSNITKSLALMVDTPIQPPDEENPKRTVLFIEFMNLGTLTSYCKPYSSGNLDDYTLVKCHTLDLFTQVVKGIEYMHLQGYCHCDMKPDNILIHRESDGSLVAKVSDLGSTKTDKFDIYALGAIIINIITQTPLSTNWGDSITWEYKQKFLNQYIRNPDLLRMVMFCIHDNPEERRTATELLVNLSHMMQIDFDPINLQNDDSKKLKSPTRYDIFEAKFKVTFIGDDVLLNSAALKKLVKPPANTVTSKGLNSNLLAEFPSLMCDGDEDSWEEDFHIFLDSLIDIVTE